MIIKAIKFYVLLFVGLLSVLPVSSAMAEQKLMSFNIGMDAYLYNKDCSTKGLAKVELRSSTADNFDASKINLQKYVENIQLAIGFNCPNVSRITFRGIANRTLYYAGVAEKKDGWHLVSLFASPN